MSGWQQPTPPTIPDPLGPGQLIRRSYRLYRSAPRRFLLVAALPELIRNLLALPGLIVEGLTLERVFDVLGNFLARVVADPEAYQGTDSLVLQAELEAQLQAVLLPQVDLAVFSAIAGGAGVAVGLIGSAALTAAALAAVAGRPISVADSFRRVAARPGLIRPIIALGIGWVALSLLPVALAASTDLQAWAGAPGSPRLVLIGSLLGVLGLVVSVGIVFLAVRWALFIPAVLGEALGVGPGLARGAQLTGGMRIRLGQAMAGILILQTVSGGFAAAAIGFAVGLSVGSAAVGVVAYLVMSLVGTLLWAPMLPALLALVYRDRSGATGTPDT